MSDECAHGSLRRSCEICEAADEITRLRTRVAELEAIIREAVEWFARPDPWVDGKTYPLWQDAADYLRKHGLKEEVSDE